MARSKEAQDGEKPSVKKPTSRLNKISPLRLPGKVKNLALNKRNGSKGPAADEKPLATLRVQVVSGTNLIGKDKGGTSSDPFVTISLPPTRVATPVIKKSLDPIFPEKESTFDLPIYASQASRLGAIEAVVWDKDLLRKEFLGEVSIKIENWFPEGKAHVWNADSKPVHATLVSSRRKTRVSGSIQLRVGFLAPTSDPAHPGLGSMDFETLYEDLVRRSSEPSLRAVAPYEGIGTVLSGDGGSDLEDDGLSDSSDTDDEFEPSNHSPLPSPAALPVATTSTPSTSSSASSLSVPQLALATSKEKKSAKGGYFDVPASSSPASTPSGGRTPKFRAPKIKKSSKGKDWSYSHSKDILGIVMIEIKSAEDLPRLKNMLKTGFDMDPFVVTSFGKKVFRTRVIRHSLNPVWEEKLLFHVKQYESNFTVQFDILDWDKLSGNDAIGTASIPLAELMAAAPRPDSETGLHNSDGKHEMKEFKLLLATPDSKWDMHKPSLTVRAKFEPYDALRQKFWREYIKTYDADATGKISLTELQAMLDSLGSTLTEETIEGYYKTNGVDPHEGELTIEQVIQSLEEEVKKTSAEKKVVGPDEEHHPSSGASTPNIDAAGALPLDPLDKHGRANLTIPLGMTGPSAPPSQEEAKADPTRAAEMGNGPRLEEVEQTTLLEEDESDEDEDDLKEESKERVINIKTCPLCHRSRLSKRTEVDIITHLAVCASADWGRVNRLVVGNFVTSSQAQRKWVSKIISKVSSGAYSIGANSANIIVQDRVSGQLQEEKMASYVRFGIRVLYKGARSRMEGGRARKLLKSLSIKQGLKYDSPESAAEIPAFIAFHRLNVNEILDPLESFKTFNQFFYRKLKLSARPIQDADDPNVLVSSADCRLMCFDTVDQAQKLWIKGREFTIDRLLGEKFAHEASKFHGGSVGIFRLAPQDYHRFHFPIDGTVTGIEKIEGAYYTVNPQAIRTQLDVYGENVRSVVKIDSPTFGTVFAVCVGAMMVGSIHHEMKVGDTVKKGDEMGYFAFGGSTIVLLLETGVLQWDEDLRLNAQASLETLVQMGTKLGVRKKREDGLPPVPPRAPINPPP